MTPQQKRNAEFVIAYELSKFPHNLRDWARANKLYYIADVVRTVCDVLGFELQDSHWGTTLHDKTTSGVFFLTESFFNEPEEMEEDNQLPFQFT